MGRRNPLRLCSYCCSSSPEQKGLQVISLFATKPQQDTTRLSYLHGKLQFLTSLQDSLKFHENYQAPLLGPTLQSKFNGQTPNNPVNGTKDNLASIIIDLNDTHQWTREQIADWLDTLDQQPVFFPHIKKCTPYYVRHNIAGPPRSIMIWACSCSVTNNSSEIVEYAPGMA